MNYIINDDKYYDIVLDILNNKDYKEIDNCIHHGKSRLDHCLKVSYYSYKISSFLKLNYKDAAVGGLLHDFFLTEHYDKKNKVNSTFTHPKKALENSDAIFNINEIEKDIIISHMFPIIPKNIPKYAESWIVSLVDKMVGLFEFAVEYKSIFRVKFRNATVILAILLFK